MNYFQNVQSLSALKAQYRQLVLANHPDKGGDTKVMQLINDQFGKLFKAFQSGTCTNHSTANGYENDFNEARTASEYTRHVYEEYGWTGSNYFHLRAFQNYSYPSHMAKKNLPSIHLHR